MAWQLGAAPLAGALRERILSTSEGNPLFVQELVRMLIDDGLIVRGNGSWQATAELRELAMPPTIQALLAARLDQLEPSEREVAQRAAIVGPLFSWGAVRELCRDSVPGLSGSLHALVRKEVIVPAAGPPGAEDAFRFAHILVRDAAYAGLRQADARRAARTLRALGGAVVPGAVPGSRRTSSGSTSSRPPPSRGSSVTRATPTASAREASAHLASAGRRALAAGDLPAASNLLGRAADNLPAGDPQRLAIRLQSIPALFETGRLAEADAQVAEILDVATSPELLDGRSRLARVFRFAERNRCLRGDGGRVARGQRARGRSCRSGRRARHSRQDEVLERCGRSRRRDLAARSGPGCARRRRARGSGDPRLAAHLHHVRADCA